MHEPEEKTFEAEAKPDREQVTCVYPSDLDVCVPVFLRVSLEAVSQLQLCGLFLVRPFPALFRGLCLGGFLCGLGVSAVN